MWCGAVWCGAVWCGAVQCGAVWHYSLRFQRDHYTLLQQSQYRMYGFRGRVILIKVM